MANIWNIDECAESLYGRSRTWLRLLDMSDQTVQGARGNTPPYVSYPSFKTLIGELHEHGVPSRIDRSVLRRFSGIVGTQLMTSLRFLHLIDGNGHPKPHLNELVSAFGTDEWKPKLITLLQEHYSAIFGLDLGNATASHFNETFRKAYSASDQVSQKCVAFFLGAAKDGGIFISDRVLHGRKPRTANASIRMRKPRISKKSDETENAKTEINGRRDLSEETEVSFERELLAKFPAFDPEWSDDLKTQWFKGFQQFMDITKGHSKE